MKRPHQYRTGLRYPRWLVIALIVAVFVITGVKVAHIHKSYILEAGKTVHAQFGPDTICVLCAISLHSIPSMLVTEAPVAPLESEATVNTLPSFHPVLTSFSYFIRPPPVA